MNFIKMHGCANDFIVIHDLTDDNVDSLKERAGALCDRRRGIGADGIAAVLPSQTADFRMRIINADGSEPEMCGNAVRCVSVYVRARGLTTKDTLTIETLGGSIGTQRCGDLIRVNMGSPILEARDIPVAEGSGRVLMKDIVLHDEIFLVTAVSMSNPHAVIYADDLTDDLVLGYGKILESHPFFPNRTNVEFVKVLSSDEITMRVFERGVGETQACGTGACAGVVAGILNKRHGNAVTVHLRGGDLLVEWDGDPAHPVYMTGPAEEVFEGSVDIEL